MHDSRTNDVAGYLSNVRTSGRARVCSPQGSAGRRLMNPKTQGPLAEYAALRQEVAARLGFMHQLLALQLTVTGTVIAVSFSTVGRSSLLLILPWSSYLLCGRYVSQEYGIDRIGEYHRQWLSRRIPGSLGWEQWMMDHPRQITNLGWRIPLFVAFPGIAAFALAWTANSIFHVRNLTDATIAGIVIWVVGLILTTLSVMTINSILKYRSRAHIVTFQLDRNRSFSALIFDVDGLIIDSERVERESWQEAARLCDRTISDAVFSTMIGLSHEAVRSLLIKEWSDRRGAEDDFDRIFASKLEIASKKSIEKMPGLDSFMSWAESLSIPMAIASSTQRDLVADRLKRAHVDKSRFKVNVCGDDVSKVKPAPDIYQLAAQRLRIDPHACVAFEDSDNGIRAAHAAEMIPILIPDPSLRANSALPEDVQDAIVVQFTSLSEAEEYFRRKIWL